MRKICTMIYLLDRLTNIRKTEIASLKGPCMKDYFSVAEGSLKTERCGQNGV